MVVFGILVVGTGLLGLAILKLRKPSEEPSPVPVPVERTDPRRG